ncbi:MAG: hypothetical protein ACK44D_04015, partial [Bacteroidia bacterium]
MNTSIVDLAVVLTFSYLLLSIIASTIHELFLTLIKARSRMLLKALNNMFFDETWKSETSKLLLNSPSIRALQQDAKKFPAYIPASSFASAILGIIRNGSTDPITVESIRARLNDEQSLIKGEARIALLNILDSANNDYEKFIRGVESFYDSSMDRVSGWFKSRYQIYMLIISAFVSVFLNVDSIHLAQTLWADKVKLEQMANAAKNEFKNIEKTDKEIILSGSNNNPTIRIDIDKNTDTTTIGIDSALSLLKLQQKDIATAMQKVKTSGLPMGWENRQAFVGAFKWEPRLAVRIAGWLITTLAVFMGAP